MDTTITTEPAGKRARNGSVILTDRMCEKRVAKRVKFYDRKCPGLYVSITTAGVATFSFKFTDPETGKQRTGWLGVYNPETFTVEDARSKVYGLRGMGGDALAETFRDRKVRAGKAGQDRRRDHRGADRVDEDAGPQAGRRNAAPDRKLGERRQPSAALHQPPARQEDRERSHQARHCDAVERHRCRQARRSFGRQCPPHAARGLGPVQLGGGSGPRLCDRQPLRQPAEARPGASAHARPVRGRDQDLLARPRPGRPALGSQDPSRAEVRAGHHAALGRTAGRAPRRAVRPRRRQSALRRPAEAGQEAARDPAAAVRSGGGDHQGSADSDKQHSSSPARSAISR